MTDEHKNKFDDAYWREQLDDQTFYVARQKGTERPYTGRFDHSSPEGVYQCSACDKPLFESDHKFDSGCGWPAFSEPVKGAIDEHIDGSHGMMRTEVTCHHCGAHLGHVFTDGPTAKGLRYCINSVSLKHDGQQG